MRTISHNIYKDTHPHGQTIYNIVAVETIHATTGDEVSSHTLPTYYASFEEAKEARDALVNFLFGEA